MFKKVYLEITNVCNLSCAFCPGTARRARFLSPAEFEALAGKLVGHTRYLYFHLMGEPLLHPELAALLKIAGRLGFRVNLTTNGTLLPRMADVLLAAPELHRVNLSLQSWEANPAVETLETYILGCAGFAKAAAAQGVLCSLRLWNGGGAEARNLEILALLRQAFPGEWQKAQRNTVLADRVFLEFGEKFDWPGLGAAETGASFCHGLRDQIGVLCDGTVVPCCLDAEGALALGNLFDSELDEILGSPRAYAIYDGFSHRTAVEPLCRRCGYAAKF